MMSHTRRLLNLPNLIIFTCVVIAILECLKSLQWAEDLARRQKESYKELVQLKTRVATDVNNTLHPLLEFETALVVHNAETAQRVNSLMQKTGLPLPPLQAVTPAYPPRSISFQSVMGKDSDPFEHNPERVPFRADGFPILTDDQIAYYSTHFHPKDPRAKLPPYVGDMCGYRYPNSGCPNCRMVRNIEDVHAMIAQFKESAGGKRVPKIEVIAWPVIRNLTTERYHLLGRPKLQWNLQEFFIPPGCVPGLYGKSTEHTFKPGSQLPDLEGTRMPFGMIIRDGLINARGNVYMPEEDAMIVGGCRHNWPRQAKKGKPVANYKKVLVLSQFWGFGPYHWLIECLPRLMLFTHLLADEEVMIHIPLLADYNKGPRTLVPHIVNTTLAFLNIPNVTERMIWGEVSADTIYLPPFTTCLMSDPIRTPFLGQYLQSILRQRVGDRMLPEGTHPNDGKGHILVIKRKTSRRLGQHDEFMLRLGQYFPNRKLVIFGDDPPPSFEDSLLLFHNADMIVGPHGAGESNMIGSRDGTRLFEFIVSDHFPGFCYQLLASTLGVKYWGLSPFENERDSQINVNRREFHAALFRIDALLRNDLINVLGAVDLAGGAKVCKMSYNGGIDIKMCI